MNHIECFVNKALDNIDFKVTLLQIQDSFKSYGLAVLEIIWDKYPNGYYYVNHFRICSPKAFNNFPGTIPARKFLVFKEYPTRTIFVETINRDLIKWIVDVNFRDVKQYPVWQIPEYV